MNEIEIPRENANDDEVLVTLVKVANGAFIEKGKHLFSFETSKATVDFESPVSGYISSLHISPGNLAKVDSLVCMISDSLQTEPASADAMQNLVLVESNFAYSHVTEAALKLIESGKQPITPSKWISSSSFLVDSLNIRPSDTTKSDLHSEFTSIRSPLAHKLVAIDRRKQLEIKALSSNSPYLNSTIGIEVKFRTRRIPSTMFNNSILDLVLYETCNLLKTNYTDLNRYYYDKDKLGVYERVMPGYAVDNGNNLTVLNTGDFSTLQELEKIIISQVARFEENKLLGDDLATSTFTVSDLSATEVEYMLPLINGQQTFILGIVRSEAGFKIFGTFDHRVTDGRRFSNFLGELKRRLLLYCNVNTPDSRQLLCCSFCDKTLSEEKSLRNVGFIKLDDGHGEKLICRNCFDGW